MKSELTRREFIKSGAVTATAFTILQAGSARTYGANEKLNIVSVGAGGQAGGDIMALSSENIVGLCDVDWNRASGIFKRFPKASRFKDYRKMLDAMEKEVDAVIVGTPDHHHFHASLNAVQRGKHVYCEKPLTHSVWEARALGKAARAAKVATQMGNQAQASEETRRPAGGSNFDWAGPLTESVLLGNIPLLVELRAELTKVKLRWDTEKFAFPNHAGANQFLRLDYRKGWGVNL